MIKSITLTRTRTGKYYASLLVKDGVAAPKPINIIDDVIGVDVGLSHLAIDSKGTKTPNPRLLKRAQDNLPRKQKALSRCHKGSKRPAKARLKLAKVHERLGADFQHKLSRQLIDENQAIAVETRVVKNMLKNRRLAKPIADASWHSLSHRLAYKVREQGKHLVKIGRWFASSKTCARCDHKVKAMPLHVRPANRRMIVTSMPRSLSANRAF